MIHASLVESWGSDRRIIECARESTDASFRGWGSDLKFLERLWTHRHTSPFEHAGMTVRCEAPLFVLGQIVRHRTFSYNVFSMRYSEVEMSSDGWHWTPVTWRAQAATNKQSSVESGDIEQEYCNWVFNVVMQRCMWGYESLIKAGVCREQARAVLPQATMTRWTMSGNLRNWLHLLDLRLAPDAQAETRELAEYFSTFVRERFPFTAYAAGF